MSTSNDWSAAALRLPAPCVCREVPLCNQHKWAVQALADAFAEGQAWTQMEGIRIHRQGYEEGLAEGQRSKRVTCALCQADTADVKYAHCYACRQKLVETSEAEGARREREKWTEFVGHGDDCTCATCVECYAACRAAALRGEGHVHSDDCWTSLSSGPMCGKKEPAEHWTCIECGFPDGQHEPYCLKERAEGGGT